LADIVIYNITCLDDLVEATTYLLTLAGRGETDLFEDGIFSLAKGSEVISDIDLEVMVGMDDEFDCIYDNVHTAHCTCISDARTTDPRQLRLLEVEHHFGPMQYIPCPRMGTHSKLTECWMCWCDVDRGVITETMALAPATVI